MYLESPGSVQRLPFLCVDITMENKTPLFLHLPCSACVMSLNTFGNSTQNILFFPETKQELGKINAFVQQVPLPHHAPLGSPLFITTPVQFLPQTYFGGTGCSSALYWLLWPIILWLSHDVFSTETSYFSSPLRLAVSKGLKRADSTLLPFHLKTEEIPAFETLWVL